MRRPALCTVCLFVCACVACGGSNTPAAPADDTTTVDDVDGGDADDAANNPGDPIVGDDGDVTMADNDDSGDGGDIDDQGDDAPALDDPPLIPITYAEAGCTLVTPCGGELAGGWYFASSCVEAVDLAAVLEVVDTVCGDGNSEVSSFSGTLQGTAVFTGSDLIRSYTRSQTFGLTLKGDVCGTAAGCLVLEAALETAGITGTCESHIQTTSCTCTVTEDVDIETTDAYTVSDNQLVLSAPTRTYDYCVEDGRVRYSNETDVVELVAP